MDIYLEEVFKLAEDSNKDDKSKCILLKVLNIHKENCLNCVCECKKSTFTDVKGVINTEAVYCLIENIFSWSLN